NFVVSPPNAVVISVPDFAVGPGQPVNVPFDRVGIPLNLSDGNGITAIDFTITYDPALLTLNGVDSGASLPVNLISQEIDVSRPGALRVSSLLSAPLSAGPVELLRLTGFVPSDARYKAVDLIAFEIARVNDGAIPAVTDDALHLVAYIGDTTGNGAY